MDNYWIKNGIKESLFYMNKIYSLSKDNDFDISVAVYPWPSQILFDEDTGQEQVDIWSKFCEGKCKYFLNYIDSLALETDFVFYNFYLRIELFLVRWARLL